VRLRLKRLDTPYVRWSSGFSGQVPVGSRGCILITRQVGLRSIAPHRTNPSRHLRSRRQVGYVQRFRADAPLEFGLQPAPVDGRGCISVARQVGLHGIAPLKANPARHFHSRRLKPELQRFDIDAQLVTRIYAHPPQAERGNPTDKICQANPVVKSRLSSVGLIPFVFLHRSAIN
jgi:hypothetical protein